MPEFLTLDDIDAKSKIVLVRVDFNVPMKDGKIADATRIERSLPTIRHLMNAGARVVLLSHLGRPDGKPDPIYSLRPVAAALEGLLGVPVAFVESCIGPKTREAIAGLPEGQVLLLENVRFYAGEEANDPAFTEELASLGHIFVNDAFSVSHRAHATTAGLAGLLPAAAGRLMQEELAALGKVLEKPDRPAAAIAGGAKISTKLALLRNLIARVDLLIPGGGMANTFLAASGFAVGRSLVESGMLETARGIMAEAERRGCRVLLPADAVVADAVKADADVKTVAMGNIPQDMMILDLGPETVAQIKTALGDCRTVVWNGPLGVFEMPPFDAATNEIAAYVADMTRSGKLMSVAGGGDTVAALAHAGVMRDIGYVSTAGGAFLEWLEGKQLPGVAVLERSARR